MKNRPLVSVIMPVFNHAKYVKRTINSLLAQTYNNWELIVINDGSTDNTEEAVLSFLDPRIQYMTQPNQGVKNLSGTINRGLAVAKGELVTMLPSDDLWPPHRLEIQVPKFNDSEVVLVHGKQNLIDENDEIIGRSKVSKNIHNMDNNPIGSIFNEMLFHNIIQQPTVLIRKKTLSKIGGYLQPPGMLAEDYPTQLELAKYGTFCFIDEVLAHYRMHPAQMTRNHFLEMVKTDIEYVLKFYGNLDDTIKENINWNEKTLADALNKRLYSAHFNAGRQLLLSNDWIEARKCFYKSVLRGNVSSKIKSLAGIMFSSIHRDMEVLTYFSKRTASLR